MPLPAVRCIVPVPEMPENGRKRPPLFCPGPSVEDIILCLCEETVGHQHFLHLVLYLLHASEALVTGKAIAPEPSDVERYADSEPCRLSGLEERIAH